MLVKWNAYSNLEGILSCFLVKMRFWKQLYTTDFSDGYFSSLETKLADCFEILLKLSTLDSLNCRVSFSIKKITAGRLCAFFFVFFTVNLDETRETAFLHDVMVKSL